MSETSFDSNFNLFNEKIILCTNHDKLMHLTIYVDNDDELKAKYVESAKKHNDKIINEPHFFDAGFDMFLPKKKKSDDSHGTFFHSNLGNGAEANKIDFKIKCCAKIYNFTDSGLKMFNTGFYVHPRSSLSKTPLRLANSTGIIDAGYRGSLIGMFDCICSDNINWFQEEESRLLQICAPSLIPIYVKIVDNISELGPNTSRGEGGIGSTGK